MTYSALDSSALQENILSKKHEVIGVGYRDIGIEWEFAM